MEQGDSEVEVVLRQLTPWGKATPATLFYNRATRKLGVVGLKHLVFFDEVANTRFDDAETSISVLKDYMQTGKFSRGDREFSAQCSIVLGGNIDTNLERREPDGQYLPWNQRSHSPGFCFKSRIMRQKSSKSGLRTWPGNQ